MIKILWGLLFQEQHKTQGDVTQSPRAMAKFLKEAARVKQVLSANTEIYAQVSMSLLNNDHYGRNCWLIGGG